MRKTQSIEVIGIGSFDIYPIKPIEQEFKEITRDGKPLKKVIAEKGTTAKYKWIDSENKEYTKQEVFYDVYGNILQSVKRTEKVKKFDIVSKADICLSESTTSILSCDETTIKNFEEKIKNNAIEFTLKKSTNGFKWVKAYILKMYGQLVLVSGLGNIKEAIKEFEKQDIAKQEMEVIIQKVEMKADELEIVI
jgi:hypothetical protein